jgi:hypothetical protein
MRATLASVAMRSAAESTLIINYHTAHRRFIARLIFRLIGEPQISARTREEMATELASVGFDVHDDSGMLDWNVRYARSEARVQRGETCESSLPGSRKCHRERSEGSTVRIL